MCFIHLYKDISYKCIHLTFNYLKKKEYVAFTSCHWRYNVRSCIEYPKHIVYVGFDNIYAGPLLNISSSNISNDYHTLHALNNVELYHTKMFHSIDQWILIINTTFLAVAMLPQPLPMKRSWSTSCYVTGRTSLVLLLHTSDLCKMTGQSRSRVMLPFRSSLISMSKSSPLPLSCGSLW